MILHKQNKYILSAYKRINIAVLTTINSSFNINTKALETFSFDNQEKGKVFKISLNLSKISKESKTILICLSWKFFLIEARNNL